MLNARLIFVDDPITFFDRNSLALVFQVQIDLNKEVSMMRSCQWLLLSVSALSLPVFAEEQGFDNFLLASPSIVSPSQFYQVKGGRFEAFLGTISGSVEGDNYTADSSFQGLAAGYAQGLVNNQLVLGADVQFISGKTELLNREYKSSNTEITPTVAFNLTPVFSIGAAAHVISGEVDDGTDPQTSSYTTFTIGGTMHQDAWEGSLAFTTKNQDDEKTQNASPQEIRLHGRYKVLPVMALGLRYDQLDFPGIAGPDDSYETETASTLILESAFSEEFTIEVAFHSTSNVGGIESKDGTAFDIAGQYKLAPNLELGARVSLSTEEGDEDKSSLNSFGVMLTSRI